MKQYQEIWLNVIKSENGNISNICKNIVSDDSGGTNELTQILAGLVLKNLEKIEKLEHELEHTHDYDELSY